MKAAVIAVKSGVETTSDGSVKQQQLQPEFEQREHSHRAAEERSKGSSYNRFRQIGITASSRMAVQEDSINGLSRVSSALQTSYTRGQTYGSLVHKSLETVRNSIQRASKQEKFDWVGPGQLIDTALKTVPSLPVLSASAVELMEAPIT